MNVGEVWHFPESEDAGRKANNEKIRVSVESTADHFGPRLIEIVFSRDSPSRVGDRILVRAWVDFRFIVAILVPVVVLVWFAIPDEGGTVPADSVYLDSCQ